MGKIIRDRLNIFYKLKFDVTWKIEVRSRVKVDLFSLGAIASSERIYHKIKQDFVRLFSHGLWK